MRPSPRAPLLLALALPLVVAGCRERPLPWTADGAPPRPDAPRLRDARADLRRGDGPLRDARRADRPRPPRDHGAPDRRRWDSRPRPDRAKAPCPAGMALVGGACMDRYEAPNQAGTLPLVMYTYTEAQAWCAARGKRLCYDDEWQLACATAAGWAYPYGQTRVPGRCNDDKLWKVYSQSKLSAWPPSASAPSVTSLAGLLAAARAVSSSAKVAADHVQSLYQGTPSGNKSGCVNSFGVHDLCGNVEEWTTRRDGGSGPSFSGNLKGRYWAEARTCQSSVKSHGNAFRFYEIGFRCCAARR